LFSGIVEGIGRVAALRGEGGAVARLEVHMGTLLDDLRLGASVAINGVCLTLAERGRGVAGFDVVPETLQRTTLGGLRPGARVNLERSLRMGDRIDGHFVQGHVDGVGKVTRVTRDNGAHLLAVAAPPELHPYLVRKGSVAVDGTSLTLVAVTPPEFTVALIPATLERTVLGERRAGDAVNLETDLLARIVVAQMKSRLADGGEYALPRPWLEGGLAP
jgi:riboflavin synthase